MGKNIFLILLAFFALLSACGSSGSGGGSDVAVNNPDVPGDPGTPGEPGIPDPSIPDNPDNPDKPVIYTNFPGHGKSIAIDSKGRTLVSGITAKDFESFIMNPSSAKMFTIRVADGKVDTTFGQEGIVLGSNTVSNYVFTDNNDNVLVAGIPYLSAGPIVVYKFSHDGTYAGQFTACDNATTDIFPVITKNGIFGAGDKQIGSPIFGKHEMEIYECLGKELRVVASYGGNPNTGAITLDATADVSGIVYSLGWMYTPGTSNGNKSLIVLTSTGKVITHSIDPLDPWPMDVAVDDATGNIFVAGYNSRAPEVTVWIFNRDGLLLDKKLYQVTGNLSEPSGISVDSKNRLLLVTGDVDFKVTVWKFKI